MPTPNKGKQPFFFSSVGKAKSLLPQIYFQYIFSHTVYLNLGPLLVTSAEVHNVVALKEQPKPLGWCVVEWEAHWP